MTFLTDAYPAHQRQRWVRSDARRWIRPDARVFSNPALADATPDNFWTPGTQLANIIPVCILRGVSRTVNLLRTEGVQRIL